ncbi:hypothetical protein [Streptomyces sioyaensis]|uniref:hypothetical protein n=1 Tax=Streptomyces sioyaensis TaxID=67364 RepID=UPI0037B63178
MRPRPGAGPFLFCTGVSADRMADSSVRTAFCSVRTAHSAVRTAVSAVVSAVRTADSSLRTAVLLPRRGRARRGGVLVRKGICRVQVPGWVLAPQGFRHVHDLPRHDGPAVPGSARFPHVLQVGVLRQVRTGARPV